MAESNGGRYFPGAQRYRKPDFCAGTSGIRPHDIKKRVSPRFKEGLHPELPCNYYEDNDPFNIPVLSWRNTSNTLYANWLNYYVYQTTDYILKADEE